MIPVSEIPTDAAGIALLSIKESLQQLERELQVTAPDLTGWMYDLNANLRSFPDLVHLLSDAEIKPLYEAIMLHSSVHIIKPKAAKAPSAAALAKAEKADKLAAAAAKQKDIFALYAAKQAPVGDGGDLDGI